MKLDLVPGQANTFWVVELDLHMWHLYKVLPSRGAQERYMSQIMTCEQLVSCGHVGGY